MDAHTNGVSPDEQISRLVSTRIEELTHRRAQLTDEVKQINAALKRYDRMQTVLEGQPHREPATPKPKRRKGQRLSPERLDQPRPARRRRPHDGRDRIRHTPRRAQRAQAPMAAQHARTPQHRWTQREMEARLMDPDMTRRVTRVQKALEARNAHITETVLHPRGVRLSVVTVYGKPFTVKLNKPPKPKPDEQDQS